MAVFVAEQLSFRHLRVFCFLFASCKALPTHPLDPFIEVYWSHDFLAVPFDADCAFCLRFHFFILFHARTAAASVRRSGPDMSHAKQQTENQFDPVKRVVSCT